MAKFKIYLCGAMSSGSKGMLSFEEMNGWRQKATDLLADIAETINPCDYYNFNMDKSFYTESEVKEFDLYMVRKSDLVLLNLDHPNSIGTAIEAHTAHDVWKIPVVGFGTTPNHPWIELCLSKKCPNMESAIDYIAKFYLRR
jgi:hypothetical protein